LKSKTLFYNGRIYTQANRLRVDSMAISRNRIVAVGNRLEHDPDFKSYSRYDLNGLTVVPGMVDAHTHFVFFARTLGFVMLDYETSLDTCVDKIRLFSRRKRADEWIIGEGYSPDKFPTRVEPDRHLLDKVTGRRPAFIFSKDQHSAWVNSRALEIAGIDERTPDPEGGEIVRFDDGTPSGIVREGPAISLIYNRIPQPTTKELSRCYGKALKYAYSKGVTGVHSFDSPEMFSFLSSLAERGALGLRINYYPQARVLPDLIRQQIKYGTGNEYLRIAGVKVFADGALGSQTALCFNTYTGSKDNYGMEVTPVKEMRHIVKEAARLGLPCAIHAIGDRAVSNVLDAFEQSPPLSSGARHRIEHLQLMRRKDIARLKRLNVVASMQPSHCPADMVMVRRYWGKRGANAYIFRTLLDRGIDLAFGSDAPIEPIDPIAGVAHAVRRAHPGSRDVFHPEQRITAAEALHGFTVGPAIAAGQSDCRGYLMPDYPADFVILDKDITQVAPSRIYDIEVLATVLDGQIKHADNSLKL